MEKKRDPKTGRGQKSALPETEAEIEARKALTNPPKDKREITIGPTTGAGPDITIE